jgi:CHAT domain-containing protein/Tfp pilus assembly protein PilF
MRRAIVAVLLIVVSVTAFHARAAAPPISMQSLQRDLKRAALLEAQAFQHALAGRFADALKVHRETLRLRSRWLPEKHHLVQGSKQDVAAWARLAHLSGDQQKQLGIALRLDSQGGQLLGQGKYAAAERSCREALQIRRQVLGEQHPDTATSYNNVGVCLTGQGQHAKALPLFEMALHIRRKVLGEQHPHTAVSYNNVARCLDAQGQHAKALPLFEKALHIRRKVLGEQHPDTAQSYNNVAYCLNAQGQHGKASPLFEKALHIRRKVLGEQHPYTAQSYDNVARCLDAQGQHAKALPLSEKAVAIRRQVLGEQHPHTAASYNNVALCLDAQGQHAKALPLHDKAMTIRRQVLGEQHPDTAISYNNVALCLDAQGQHGKALPLHDKALHICCKLLGEQHPHTATSYDNLASCLDAQGQYAKALPLHDKALAIRRQVLGEQHPHTAQSSNNMALCLWRLDRVAEATRLLQRSLPGQEVARFHRASSGFERALAGQRGISPGQLLALGLARLRQPSHAFAHADASLARALLDDLLRGDPDVSALATRLARLDDRLVLLYGRTDLSPEQAERREQLLRQRRALAATLSRSAAAASKRQVLPVADIQKHIPPQAALVLWLAFPDLKEYQACIVRQRGTPVWVRVRGSGKDGHWTKDDQLLPQRLYDLLVDPQAGSTLERHKAIAAMRRLWLEPLLANLRGRDGLPAVGHLLVVPTGWVASIPLEVLTSEYRISYVPSGSAFARLRQQARLLSGTSLLALGDPAFSRKPDPRPESLFVQRGPDPAPLPGARREVAALADLVPHATTWLGSDASEQRLDDLIRQGKLKSYRLVHLATHGQPNWEEPKLSAVLLARDSLPDPLTQAQQGKKVSTGELTVETILSRDWRDALDADLVVLSACVTGLGTYSHGDGMLGFAQAFLSRGARCVVLSRWYVSDDATALLMRRFYQNLLGKRPGLKQPLGRAAALEEARNWLRSLTRQEAGAAVASLPRGEVKPLPGTAKAPPPRPVPPGEKPYAHPYYWSAFVLIGDPD